MTRRTVNHWLLPLLGLICLGGQTAQAGLSSSASFAFSQSGSIYSYDITLNNTGTTTIGTFWFAWVPGAGFMSVAPTNVTSPTGWSEILTDGNGSIQWTTSTAKLASGTSLSGFDFQSTLTPAQLEAAYTGGGTGNGDPVATSFVYSGAPFSDAGFQFVVAQASVPEPSSFMLVGTVFAGFALRAWRRRRAAVPSPA